MEIKNVIVNGKTNDTEKLKWLFYIKDYEPFVRSDKKPKLVKVPIIKETKQSYYVPDAEWIKSKEEYFRKNGENNYRRCYLVKKDTMWAKISDYGYCNRRYYQHPFLAEESFYVSANANKIANKLAKCGNGFLLRQIAHNLEMEEEIELLDTNLEE